MSKVTITVAGLTNKDNQTVTTFDTKNDEILTTDSWNSNLNITGVGQVLWPELPQTRLRLL